MAARPAGMTIRMPSRLTSRLLSGAVTRTAAANGSARTPADSGL